MGDEIRYPCGLSDDGLPLDELIVCSYSEGISGCRRYGECPGMLSDEAADERERRELELGLACLVDERFGDDGPGSCGDPNGTGAFDAVHECDDDFADEF